MRGCGDAVAPLPATIPTSALVKHRGPLGRGVLHMIEGVYPFDRIQPITEGQNIWIRIATATKAAIGSRLVPRSRKLSERFDFSPNVETHALWAWSEFNGYAG